MFCHFAWSSPARRARAQFQPSAFAAGEDDLHAGGVSAIRYIAEYEDGSEHVFQVPQSTLEQGLPSEGRYSIACIVAYEWQQDGYLKPGKIARVYRDNSLPALSGFHA